jgi:hypothetical protein
MHSDSIFNPFFLLHDPDNWGSVKLVVTSESVMQHNSQLGQFFSGTVLQLRKLSQTRYILCSRRYYPLLIFQKTIPDPLPAAAAPTSIQVVRNDIRINCFFPLRPLPPFPDIYGMLFKCFIIGFQNILHIYCNSFLDLNKNRIPDPFGLDLLLLR